MDPKKKNAVPAKATKGYGKRPLWQWVLIYIVVAAIAYYLVYLIFFHHGGGVSY